MDRFAMQFGLGYVDSADEVAILTAQERVHPLEDLMPCATLAEVQTLKQATQEVRFSEELKRYVVELVGATRSAPGVQLGGSPRASLALMKAAQALALFDGLDFVTPEQIQELAATVIAHRLVLEPGARFSGQTARSLVEDAVKRIKVPRFGTVGLPMRYSVTVKNLSSRPQAGLTLLEELSDPRPGYPEWRRAHRAADKRTRSFRVATHAGPDWFKPAKIKAAEIPRA